VADRHLIVEHIPRLRRYARSLVGDRYVAEDLVQDAFVRIAGRLLHLRDPGGFQSYLRVTIVNLARSYHRRRTVERRPDLLAGAPPTDEEKRWLAELREGACRSSHGNDR